MAKHKVYVVRDRVVSKDQQGKDQEYTNWGQPFTDINRGAALRGWETIVNDEQATICKFPANFSLWEIGEYDQETGDLSAYENPEMIAIALDYKRAPKETIPMPLHERKAN